MSNLYVGFLIQLSPMRTKIVAKTLQVIVNCFLKKEMCTCCSSCWILNVLVYCCSALLQQLCFQYHNIITSSLSSLLVDTGGSRFSWEWQRE